LGDTDEDVRISKWNPKAWGGVRLWAGFNWHEAGKNVEYVQPIPRVVTGE
jgi:hypothetical protein